MLCWTGAGGQRLCGSPSRPDQGVGNWCSQTQLKGVRAADGAQEASGYAATLADLTGEAVLLVPFFDNTPQERAGGPHGCVPRGPSSCVRAPNVVAVTLDSIPTKRAQRCSSEASRGASAAPGALGASRPTAAFCGCARS